MPQNTLPQTVTVFLTEWQGHRPPIISQEWQLCRNGTGLHLIYSACNFSTHDVMPTTSFYRIGFHLSMENLLIFWKTYPVLFRGSASVLLYGAFLDKPGLFWYDGCRYGRDSHESDSNRPIDPAAAPCAPDDPAHAGRANRRHRQSRLQMGTRGFT